VSRELQLTHQVEHDIAAALFNERMLQRADRELHRDGWPTAARELPDLGEPILRVTAEGMRALVVEVDGVLLNVGLFGGLVNMVASAPTLEAIGSVSDRLHAELPPPDPSSAHEVTVTFWTYGPQGPMPSWRSIAVPSWDEISANYAGATRAGLERLMSGFRPAHGGQLVLWHGVAGTGKTFGLRALAWEWRDWCDFHYIVDPDTFFGQHADYLMSVLLQPEYMGGFQVPSMHGFIVHSGLNVDGEDGDGQAKPWRVLVLEDTGELLTPDAKMVIGQGLSRFLNVVDGLIGQGLRVLVLVTTNEPIKKLHPAVARPGRCAANVEFEPLAPEEASVWLSAHGVDGASGGATLAELYARAEGRDPTEMRLVGFGDDGA
jgi:hypothetical protein